MPCRDGRENEPDYAAMMRVELLCDALKVFDVCGMEPAEPLRTYRDLHRAVDATRRVMEDARRAVIKMNADARKLGFVGIGSDHPIQRSLDAATGAYYEALGRETQFLTTLYHTRASDQPKGDL